MQTIYLDISNKGVVPTVYAKQNDVGRKFAVILTDSGLPYIPEIGSVFSVWYKGASGEGNYTDIGNKSAFSLNGNKVEVEMIVQMLSAHGDGILCLTLNSPDGNQISSWNIPYMCEMVPGSESEKAEEYYTAFSKAVEELLYPDKTLSIEGKAADAAAVGEALAKKADISYTKKICNTHNLLDDSDFTNLVAQAGIGGNHGTVAYAADRWILDSGTVSYSAGVGLTLNGTIQQKLEYPPTGETSAFVGMASGSASISYTDGAVTIKSSGGVLKWAALYSGVYSAATMPEYHPKGYTAELLECRRYYRKIDAGNYFSGVATGSNKMASFMLQHEQKMRTTPTVTASDNFSIVVYTQTGYSTIAPNTSPYGVPAEVVCTTNTDNGMNIQATFDVSGVASENNTPIIVRTRTGYLDISADL